MNVKYLFIIAFFAFVSNLSFAQDSLQFIHYQNGRSVYTSSPDSSIYYFDLCAKRGYELKEDSITLTTIANCIHNIGFIYREVKNQIYQSLIFLDSAKVIYSRYEDKNLLLRSYFNIGESYYQLGDYNTAIDYYNEAVSFSDGRDPKLHSVALNNIGGIYLDKQEYTKALKYFNKSEAVDSANEQLFNIYLNKGHAYDGLGDYNKAIEFYEKAYKKTDEDNEKLFKVYNNLSVAYRKIGDYKIAQKYVRKGIKLNDSKSKSGRYNNLGDIFFNENQLDSALYYHKKAVITEAPEFEKLLKDTRIPDEEITHSGDKLDVLIYLSSFAHTLYKSKQKKEAHKVYQLCQKQINTILKYVSSPESKLELIQKSDELFNHAINVAYETGEYETAFIFSEQRKAVMLLDNLQQIDKQRYSDVPSELLDSLLILQRKIADKNCDRCKTQLSELKTSMRKYPKYEVFNTQDVDIAKIKSELVGDNSVLIEFFVGDDAIYVFKVHDTIDAHKVDRIELDTLIRGLDDVMSADMNRIRYKDYAIKIYNHVFAEFLKDVPEGIQLIIIPDGILYKTPFDALLVTEPQGYYYDLESMDYLIEHYPITYGYSANVLLQNNKSTSKSNDKSNTMLALAPEFLGGILPKLKENIAEAQESIKHFDGKVDDGTDKSTFLDQARIADYLLLATHASASVADNLKSKIFLSDQEYILMNDIQYEKFQAKMVVLSACETGKGKNEIGEGVLSFARGFAYAGVPSVTMNLWKTDDETSSKIIPRYFKYIKKGYSKPEALRKAKLDYIETEPNSSPNKWASLAHIGNPQATFNTCNFNLWWLIIVIILVASLWFLKNRRVFSATFFDF